MNPLKPGSTPEKMLVNRLKEHKTRNEDHKHRFRNRNKSDRNKNDRDKNDTKRLDADRGTHTRRYYRSEDEEEDDKRNDDGRDDDEGDDERRDDDVTSKGYRKHRRHNTTPKRKHRRVTGEFSVRYDDDGVRYSATRLSDAKAAEYCFEANYNEVVFLVERAYPTRGMAYIHGDIFMEEGKSLVIMKGNSRGVVTTCRIRRFEGLRRYDSQRVMDTAVVLCVDSAGFFRRQQGLGI